MPQMTAWRLKWQERFVGRDNSRLGGFAMEKSMKGVALGRSAYASILLAVMGVLIPGQVSAQVASAQMASAQMAALDPDPGVVTFNDVAPILRTNCMECHRSGGIGPMSLITYADTRRWASTIREKVEARDMPPWHIDKTVGIQNYKNDISLSDAQIETIASWVDAGAPEGNPAALPPMPPNPWEDEAPWLLEDQFGSPDVVFRSPGFTVPAEGLDQWVEPEVTLDMITSPRWIRATESHPAQHARAVTHHGNTDITKFGGPGAPQDVYPAETGLLVQPGQTVTFNLHYHAQGEEVEGAYVEVGLWFYPEGYEPRYKLTSATTIFDSYKDTGEGASTMLLAPNSSTQLSGYHVLSKPTWIQSVRGHQHMRGRGQSIEAIYPDGRVEVLTKYRFDHNWHIAYIYDDLYAPLLPAGTVLVVTSFLDNTSANPQNPDPEQWVVHGRRTGDEMSHIHMQTLSLTEEEFQAKVAERETLLAAQGIERQEQMDLQAREQERLFDPEKTYQNR